MCDTVNTISYYFTFVVIFTMMVAVVLFNMSPIHNNYKTGAFTNNFQENKTLEFSVNIMFPGFNPEEHFIFVTIMNLYSSYLCAVSICMMELLLCFMVFQIIGHIHVLIYNIKDTFQPEPQIIVKEFTDSGQGLFTNAEMFDAEENRNIQERLKDFVLHHKMIVKFTNNISEFFGIMLASNYLLNLVSSCLLLLECSNLDPDALARFGAVTVYAFGQLIIISLIFEIVTTVSEKIKDVVYNIPWERMNIRNQKSVCIILNRIQTPLQVTAMGMTPVGVQTMAGVLKTTFSYFTLLRSMIE